MLGLVVMFAGPALAQSHPRVFEIPDPEAELEPEPPVEVPVAPESAAPVSSGPPVRRGPRAVQGGAPTDLSGRYGVVQVTEAGQTDDFRIKMERAGKALQADCITVGMVFDFGNAPAGLPQMVTIAEQQECKKGGLGIYANELSLTMPVSWSAGEGSATMSLGESSAAAELTRLRRPDDGDMRTPSQWLSSEAKLERPAGDVKVLVEAGRGKQGPPGVVHLLMGDVIYHLEPEAGGGPFAP